jgi:splicing factor 3B subunit 1
VHTYLNGFSNRVGKVNEKEMDQDPTESEVSQKLASYTTPTLNLKDSPRGVGTKEAGIELKNPQRIIDREDDYRKRRLNKIIFPNRNYVVTMGHMNPNVVVRNHATIRQKEAFKMEKDEPLRLIVKKHKQHEKKARKSFGRMS